MKTRIPIFISDKIDFKTHTVTRDKGHYIMMKGSIQKGKTMSGCTKHAAAAAAGMSLQSCLTLCDPIDGSPPVSTIPEILQARKLEWAAIAFSAPNTGTLKYIKQTLADIKEETDNNTVLVGDF